MDAYAGEVALVQQVVEHVGTADALNEDDDLHRLVAAYKHLVSVRASGCNACRAATLRGQKSGTMNLMKQVAQTCKFPSDNHLSSKN